MPLRNSFSWFDSVLWKQLWGHVKNTPIYAKISRENAHEYPDSYQPVYQKEKGETSEQFNRRVHEDLHGRWQNSHYHLEMTMVGLNLVGIAATVLFGFAGFALSLVGLLFPPQH